MAIAKNRRSPHPLPFGFNPKVEHRNARHRKRARKHGKPTTEEQNAAITRAGHQPQRDHAKPLINHELRKTLGEQR